MAARACRRRRADDIRTEAIAERFLSEIETDIARGDWFDPLAGRVPLGEYTAQWIEERD